MESSLSILLNIACITAAIGHITHVKAHANVMKLTDRYIHVTVGQKTDIIVVAVLLIYLTSLFSFLT
jgi:hypothetical protein